MILSIVSPSMAAGSSLVQSVPVTQVEEPPKALAGEDLASTIVHLRVILDDGKPVPSARWIAYKSALDDSPLAAGVTNIDGRSSFEVPRDTLWLRIETLRSGGRAPGLTALTLGDEESVTAELRLGRGGAIKGRVIDDSGAPVSGLEIDLMATVADALAKVAEEGVGIPVATTAEDGSFAVGQVTSLADSFFSRADYRWKTLRPVELSFGPSVNESRFDHEPRYFVLGNETVDLGEIVIPRPATYSGRLVDANGVGVPGALLSTHPRRLRSVDARSLDKPGTGLRVRPGAPGFQRLENEVLTEEDGSFVFTQRKPTNALVWTRTGVRKVIQLPHVPPGARADKLEWSVGRDEVLEVVLVDGDSRRIVEPEQLFGWGKTRPMGVRYERSWGARFQLERRGGDRQLMELVADADGVFRIPLVFSREHLERLRVFMTGWLPAAVLGSALPKDGKRIELKLQPFPQVRLSVSIPAQDLRAVTLPTSRFGSPDRSAIVDVVVCKLNPVQRAAARASQKGTPWERFVPCCGSGSDFSNWAYADVGETFELDMPVQEPGEYWVYVSDLPGRPKDLELELGPIEPGPERHTVAVPPLPELPTEDAEPLRGHRRKAAAVVETVIMRGRVVDSVSGAPIRAVSVGDPVYGRNYFNGHESDSAGRFFRRLPVGDSVAVSFSKLGFEDLDSTVSMPISGNEIDLGDVPFVRTPTVQGKLIRPDGSPVQGPCRLIIPGGEPSWGTSVDDEGRFATSAELNAGQSVWLRMTLDRAGRWIDGLQRLRIEQWKPDEVNAIEVSPWRDVEIRLHGFEDSRLYSEAFVRVEPVLSENDNPLEPIVIGSMFGSAIAREIVIPSRGGVRAFRVALGTGSYRVVVERTPLAFGETEFVVRDIPGLQIVECTRN